MHFRYATILHDASQSSVAERLARSSVARRCQYSSALIEAKHNSRTLKVRIFNTYVITAEVAAGAAARTGTV